MRKEVIHALENAIVRYPLVEDGFTANDYAKAVGIAHCTANDRLRKFADDGVVRRVRVKRAGGIRQGWQLVKGK